MRSAVKLACFFGPAVLAQVPSNVACNQMSVDQCATDCRCQRVACCCGPNCDKQGGRVLYNRCVDAGSDASTWSCPTISSCASYGGRAMTITPCLPASPTPGSNSQENNGNPSGSGELDFGTTFPMLGTQPVAHNTWQDNIYMGTIMQFNPGAYWGYTDSYNAPIWNTPSYDSGGNQISNGGGVPGQPTPAPDYTGTPCYIANPCPTGYYCKLNTGNNPQQRGYCAKLSSSYWSGGAGQFTDSNFYASFVHPPLITDPNHNGPANSASSSEYGSGGSYGGGGGSYGSGGYGSSGEYGSGGGNGGGSTGNGVNSCAQPSVCGYKASNGNCWCDNKCQTSGDCCADFSQYCSYPAPNSNSLVVSGGSSSSSSSANCIQDGGQCTGRCGTSVPISVGSQQCYCDAACHTYNDCCCSVC